MFNAAMGSDGSCRTVFDKILDNIIATDPSLREARVKPHLLAFIAHPIIKELISQSENLTPTDDTQSTTLELKRIQDTLSSLSKAVDRLSKGNPPSKNPPNARKKQKGGENIQ